MPGLIDPSSELAKILLIGDQGDGKTGAKAALIAMGYKLLMIDTDRGFKILRSLLTDPHYPYAAFMKKHGINPAEPGRISYIPIDVPIDFTDVSVNRKGRAVNYSVLGPTSSAAWETVTKLLKEWKDTSDGKAISLGGINDWGPDTVLDFDTMSTLAELAKYWMQDMNGHLGAFEDDHGRDSGGAQELIMRLMTKLTNDAVKCNVIVTGHIKWVDMSNDVPQGIEERIREKKAIDAQGFPAVIGKATSPYIGKKFNDVFIVKREGNGSSLTRKIYSVPTNNTSAKNSVWLEPSYPLSTGLGEIFCALQYKDPPVELIKAIRGTTSTGKDTDVATSGSSPVAKSGFGFRPN
jgi:hypothetical protein